MTSLDEAIEHSADPATTRRVLERVVAARPDVVERLAGDPQLLAACVAVSGVSRPLSLVLETDAEALPVLGSLDRRPPVTASTADELLRWKRLEMLRLAARDLLGLDTLEATVAAISALAVDVLTASLDLVVPDGPPLAVIGMGKLGGNELNYASDIDVMFVGEGEPGGARQTGAAGARGRPSQLSSGRRPSSRTAAPAHWCARWSRSRRTGIDGQSRGSSRRS